MPVNFSADNSTVAAIILAGGKSSRMGTDKALLPLTDETLLERLVKIVHPLVSQTIVMLSDRQVRSGNYSIDLPQVTIGKDSQSEQGPLQGIADAAALLAKDTEFVIILACDLPFLSGAWLERMLRSLQESPELSAVCTKNDTKTNPLIGVYRKSVLDTAAGFLGSGRRSCLVLLDHCPHLLLEPTVDQSYQFANLNTPEDYQNAQRRLIANKRQ